MAIIFDATNSRIILDSSTVSATEIFSRWEDWAALSDNLKYGMVIRQVGSDDLGGGLSIPPYFFLQGAWRIRPMEADHTLTITGNLFVEGGGIPVVRTIGSYQVNVNYTVPVQAQGISTSGSSTSPSAATIAAEVRAELSEELNIIDYLRKIIRNDRGITPDKKLAVYDDDDITPILLKPLYDKDGNPISDLAAGILAREGRSLV